MSTDRRTRAWMEVDAGSLRRNLQAVRDAVGPAARVVAMVKADAYGLGLGTAAKCLDEMDPWGFGVATVEEGRSLRALGLERPVLVVGPVPAGAIPDAVEAGLTLSVSSLETVARLAAAARAGRRAPRGPVPFHLEIDTGMGRSGLDWRAAQEWGPRVVELAGDELFWEGCFTHFHSAEEPALASVRVQWTRFQDAVGAARPPHPPPFFHLANSAAIFRAPEVHAEGCRPGIFLYGGRPWEGPPAPEPVAAVRARVLHVRDVPPGSTQGYGATYSSRGWERWATVGLGYGDGLPRLLSNRGEGLLRGRRVPIVGRISMDLTVVETSAAGEDRPVEVGEVVTFLGRDGDEVLTLEEVAGWASTISYEILTGFTPRLPRVWLDDGSH